MSRVQIPLTGINTTSAYQEGNCSSLVNLRPKNGTLQPVAPRKTKHELSQKYDLVFVHQFSDYENWIGIINSYQYSSLYWDIRSEQPQAIQTYIQGNINSIQQIGNTISLITSDNLYYLFFQNGKYTFLGDMPQTPCIELAAYQENHMKSYFLSLYGKNTINEDNFIEATKGLVNKAMDALVNGYSDNDGKFHEGLGIQLFDACFIRYALRLYDGSLTKHSPPILIMPVRHITGTKEDKQNTPENIDSMKSIFYRIILGTLSDDSYVDVYAYNLSLNYNTTILSNSSSSYNYQAWKDIIQSVDIFMSPPIGISNIENIRKDMDMSRYGLSQTGELCFYNLIKGLSKESLKNIVNTSVFYLIKSIPLGQTTNYNPEKFPSNTSDITKMENLIFQEQMTDDNFSNHKYGAEISYAYNNRLHLANIKTSFFDGFIPNYFLWYNTADLKQGNYNGYKYADAPGVKYNRLIIEVEINTGITNERVYAYLYNYAGFAIYKLFMSAFISYPDPRAKKITIFRYSDNQWYKVFSKPLQKHDFLNLAYFLNDGLNPIVETEQTIAQIPENKKISITEQNKIKVSELNNPMNFPNKNTYTIGNGKILALATIATRISEGSFGQYPLYVFTNHGIYSLNVGTEATVYSQQSAPTSYETPSTSIVCETPFGVVFTSKRGACIINGQQVELLTESLQQKPEELNIFLNDKEKETLNKTLLNYSQTEFNKYIENIENIIYNPYENELIIIDHESEFNYILNMNSRAFYMSTEKIDGIVLNKFPELLVWEQENTKTKVKTYAEAGENKAHISLITRPILFGDPGFKRIERMILRAELWKVNNDDESKKLWAIKLYSIDGVNFNILRGIPALISKDRKDIDSGILSRAKYRQFIFALAGTMNEKSIIRYLEYQITKEYDSSKMR